jgi:hypothetical protein
MYKRYLTKGFFTKKVKELAEASSKSVLCFHGWTVSSSPPRPQWEKYKRRNQQLTTLGPKNACNSGFLVFCPSEYKSTGDTVTKPIDQIKLQIAL